MILAVDPGREKCGVALVEDDGAILSRAILPRGDAAARVCQLLAAHDLSRLALGHATTSRDFQRELLALMPQLEIVTIDETNSTLEARALYWQANAPRGWRKIVPLSLQEPPEPLDDFAALVLARRFLARK